MPIVAMPNGDQVSFPDDMPKDQIKALIAKKFPADVAAHFVDVGRALTSGMSWEQISQKVPEAQIDPSLAGAGQFIGETARNIPSSAAGVAKSIVQTVAHPQETLENLGKIGKGILQKTGILSGKDAEPFADAVGKFFMDRYGSAKAIANAVKTDPVGVAMDVSTVLSGGGAIAARAPGVIGAVGEAARVAGRAADPLQAVAGAAKVGGRIASEVGGIYTGAGTDPIQIATKAGAAGGEQGKAFLRNLAEREPIVDVVQEARNAAGVLKQQRGAAYRARMAEVGTDKTVLDFNKIDNAVDKVSGIQTFKGQVISAKAEGIRQEIQDAIEGWRQLDPAEYHTVDGLDALKQKIGKIRDKTQYGSPDRLVADSVYKSVYKTIADQSPEYAKAMKGYEEASSIIREIEGSLSLNPKANVSTALSKLQSSLRHNVATSFGRRRELVEILQEAGAKNLMQKLAGQALSDWAPRGLSRLIVGGEGAAIALHPEQTAHLLAGIIGSSPKLWGAGAYAAGAATRLPLRTLGRSALQTGRLPNTPQ